MQVYVSLFNYLYYDIMEHLKMFIDAIWLQIEQLSKESSVG